MSTPMMAGIITVAALVVLVMLRKGFASVKLN